MLKLVALVAKLFSCLWRQGSALVWQVYQVPEFCHLMLLVNLGTPEGGGFTHRSLYRKLNVKGNATDLARPRASSHLRTSLTSLSDPGSLCKDFSRHQERGVRILRPGASQHLGAGKEGDSPFCRKGGLATIEDGQAPISQHRSYARPATLHPLQLPEFNSLAGQRRLHRCNNGRVSILPLQSIFFRSSNRSPPLLYFVAPLPSHPLNGRCRFQKHQ